MTTMNEHKKKHRYSSRYLSDVLQWDTYTWRKALYYWDDVLLSQIPPAGAGDLRALDIGARDGGLSLYLADKGIQVICSDVDGPSEQACELHKCYGVDSLVTYAAVDATAMPFGDAGFDLVIFKSMLGAVGQYLGIAAVDTVLDEVYRVLKPGGLVLFAENQEGSRFHRWARRRFIPWGTTYYYLPQSEVRRLFSRFATFDFKTYGFFSCVKKDFRPLALLDRLICLSKRSPSYYMAYGYAVK